ncbi:MAG: hypothetical protein KatS3mg101_0462 [Patescibacteria group bacterium]|nr:MAG: hypothetical protein KatS3mg101_0462 [Patescibacteria group bacterium]
MINSFPSFSAFISPVRNCDVFYPEFLSFLAIIFIILLYRSVGFNSKARCVGVILLVSGGLANFIERLLSRCVWDYFNFLGLFSFNIF